MLNNMADRSVLHAPEPSKQHAAHKDLSPGRVNCLVYSIKTVMLIAKDCTTLTRLWLALQG